MTLWFSKRLTKRTGGKRRKRSKKNRSKKNRSKKNRYKKLSKKISKKISKKELKKELKKNRNKQSGGSSFQGGFPDLGGSRQGGPFTFGGVAAPSGDFRFGAPVQTPARSWRDNTPDPARAAAPAAAPGGGGFSFAPAAPTVVAPSYTAPLLTVTQRAAGWAPRAAGSRLVLPSARAPLTHAQTTVGQVGLAPPSWAQQPAGGVLSGAQQYDLGVAERQQAAAQARAQAQAQAQAHTPRMFVGRRVRCSKTRTPPQY